MDDSEGAAAEAKTLEGVNEEYAAEIEKAVNQVVIDSKEAEEEAPEKTGEETPPVKDTPKEGEEEPADQGEEQSEKSDEERQGEESPDDAEGDEKSPEAEARADELLTRAVRAGMDLKDARTFVSQDADALERQIGLLEKASQQPGKGDEEAGADESAPADEDPLSGIPDLDPEVYDENLVEGFRALKSIIKKQEETIKGLSSGAAGSSFDKMYDSLNAKLNIAAKGTELKEQYDILKAGYDAKGQQVDDAAVFQKATKLVLGDEIKAAAEASKAEKAKRREKMQTVPPGGPTAKATGDPLEEVAKEIDGKYFNKK
jgi:hypothetical protein